MATVRDGQALGGGHVAISDGRGHLGYVPGTYATRDGHQRSEMAIPFLPRGRRGRLGGRQAPKKKDTQRALALRSDLGVQGRPEPEVVVRPEEGLDADPV